MDNLFENDNYTVTVGDFDGKVTFHGGEYTSGYVVTNKNTGVREVFTPQYPDAVASAEQLDLAIEHSSWKWIRIQQETDLIMKEEDHGPQEVH